MDISGKVAIVTGGAQGIGRAVTECLLKKGARGVTIADVHEQKGQETVNEFSQQYDNERVTFMYADVTLKSQMEDVFRKTKTTFGRVDIFICNAGICNEYEWERMVDINFTSTIRNTYLAVEYMGTKNGGNGGVIIINSSTAGLTQFPVLPVYSAAKSGLVGFARSVAVRQIIDTKCSVRIGILAGYSSLFSSIGFLLDIYVYEHLTCQ
ncbi:15-hydroxyprostaglandin dehydrogenase [NAD(+)]-like [Saccoglossus kowalevskii]|uniref:15-hydroxyprostaglandin dehydrogenase [NAD(+)] n=1 Tax=Saccoglossus kowalevskii TaxID=10224 RepID=A0ABM0MLX3_SACKO|nr:PREDICTED: 15-hydroxyprostaglandin dehydrogenase [NAD(+)]-like [Saccoglossus kowalevskii]